MDTRGVGTAERTRAETRESEQVMGSARTELKVNHLNLITLVESVLSHALCDLNKESSHRPARGDTYNSELNKIRLPTDGANSEQKSSNLNR